MKKYDSVNHKNIQKHQRSPMSGCDSQSNQTTAGTDIHFLDVAYDCNDSAAELTSVRHCFLQLHLGNVKIMKSH